MVSGALQRDLAHDVPQQLDTAVEEGKEDQQAEGGHVEPPPRVPVPFDSHARSTLGPRFGRSQLLSREVLPIPRA